MGVLERLFCNCVWLAWIGLLVGRPAGRPSRGAAHDAGQQRRGVPTLDPGPDCPARVVITGRSRVPTKRCDAGRPEAPSPSVRLRFGYPLADSGLAVCSQGWQFDRTDSACISDCLASISADAGAELLNSPPVSVGLTDTAAADGRLERHGYDGQSAHVWTTPAWQRLFGEVISVGSVSTCVRPTSAVHAGTAGLDGIRRSGFLHSFTRSSGAVQISD